VSGRCPNSATAREGPIVTRQELFFADVGAPSVASPGAYANIGPRCVPAGDRRADFARLRVRHSLVQVDPFSQGGRDALQQHLVSPRTIGRNARSSPTFATHATSTRDRMRILLRFDEWRKW
jgi:hypothetical protein